MQLIEELATLLYPYTPFSSLRTPAHFLLLLSVMPVSFCLPFST